MPPVIVSLTTISSRLSGLDKVLNALLNQTFKADRVILNVSSDPFLLDKGVEIEDLPETTRRLAHQGKIEIFSVANLGPYRKLVPTLSLLNEKNNLIITADDDVIYPPNWLLGLVTAYERFGAVCAYRCRKMDSDGVVLKPYGSWPMVSFDQVGESARYKVGYSLFPTGRGGVLYSSEIFSNRSLLNELIPLAPAQDDVVFRFMALIAGCLVVAINIKESGEPGNEFRGPPVGQELWKLNTSHDGGVFSNNHAIAAVEEYVRTAGHNLSGVMSLIKSEKLSSVPGDNPPT